MKKSLRFLAVALVLILSFTSFAACKKDKPAESVKVTEVTLNKSTATILAGEELALTATVKPDDASNKNVTWSSSNSAAKVSSNGLVTGVSAGSAVITVTTEDGNKTATCAVTVSKPEKTAAQVTETFEAAGYTVDSSTESGVTVLIATKGTDHITVSFYPSEAFATAGKAVVDIAAELLGLTCKQDGKILYYGTAAAVAVYDGIAAQFVNATGITLDKTSASISAGETLGLTATVSPSDATNKTVTWSSSSGAATVSSSGLVTGVSGGSAVITAATHNGKTASCTVTVTASSGAPVYSQETEDMITGMLGALLDIVPIEGEPEWWLDLLDTAGSKFISSLKAAGITDGEINNLLDVFEDIAALFSDFDPENPEDFDISEEVISALIESLSSAAISNTKISRFIFALIQSLGDVIEKAAADAEALSIMYYIASYYDDVISLGQQQFVLVFTTLLDLVSLDISADLSSVIIAASEGEVPSLSLNEFKDIILSLKTDVLAKLNILSDEAINAICSLVKIFAPLAAMQYTDEWLEAELIWREEDIENCRYWIDHYEENYDEILEGYQWQLAFWQEYLLEYPEEVWALYYVNYYQGEIDNFPDHIAGQIEYYENRIEHHTKLIEKFEAALGRDYSFSQEMTDEIIDAVDYFAEKFANARTSANAALNRIDNALIEAFYKGLTGQEGYYDAAVIAVGKILYAGAAVSGGLDKDLIFDIYIKAYDLASIMDYVGYNVEDDVKNAIDKFYSDLAYLNGLGYTATISDEKIDEGGFISILWYTLSNRRVIENDREVEYEVKY